MNHYPRHVGDFIGATIGLSLMERGAYSALLDRYYMDETPLPLDRREVYRMAACTSAAERKAVDYVLTRYFTEQADGWHQKRADVEIEKFKERSDSAKRSINARWDKRNTNVSESNSERNSNQEPVTSNQEPKEWKERSEPPTPEAGKLPGTLTAATWALWKQHLADKRKGMSVPTERMQLAQLLGHTDAEAIVQNAIRNGHLRLEPVGGWPDKRTPSKSDLVQAVNSEIFKGQTNERPAERVIDGEAHRVA